MDTCIYIDGFNFYYGAVKDTPHKWLDFKSLFQSILPPNYVISSIKYFTARVSATPHDPGKPNRQDRLIEALKAHIPEIEIHEGNFTTHERWFNLSNHRGDQLRSNDFLAARVDETKEKGSDVKLAVHLVNDAHKQSYECFVVVSNDSDLAEAMKIVKGMPRTLVILMTPPRFKRTRSTLLKTHSHQAWKIKSSHLADSQLPDPVVDSTTGKRYARPAEWW
ncbi:MAG: NYN domain-containing protein [Pseudomonadota bacterium]